MDLLAHGIPITLLMDLADPSGPQSADLLEHERACRPCRADVALADLV